MSRERDVEIGAAREARRAARREMKRIAAARPQTQTATVDSTVGRVDRSEDDRALYALLLARPSLAERVYRRFVDPACSASGSALQGILVRDALFGDQ